MQALRQMAPRAKRFRHSRRHSLLSNLMETAPMSSAQAVHPAHFYCSPIRSSQASGEIALLYAILEDAIDCFRKQFVSRKRRDLRLAREAEEWLFSESAHWSFSFVNICAVVGLDPGYIRIGLKRWQQYTPTREPRSTRRPTQLRQPLRFAS